MTEYASRDLAALDRVEELLDAYADARLSPTGPVLARMRRHVLAKAPAAGAASRVPNADRVGGRWWSILPLRVPRKVVALGMAATLTLGTTAAVLAAPPGSPFYNARVAIELAFLPSQVDQRLAAHEERLSQRLAEAEAAAASGDLGALAAALAAYDAEVEAAVGDVGDDQDRLAHVEAMLVRHVAVLTALETRLPEQASIDTALENSQKAIEKVKAKGSQVGGKPSTVPGQTR